MKSYIIFTPEITNMGGAQMYTANKVVFLKSQGWQVSVFFAKKKGDVLIPELKEYSDNLIKGLGVSLCFMPRFIKKRLFHRLKSVCESSEEIVFESQILSYSFFVEEAASYLGARHIINTLDEQVPQTLKHQNKFFIYKLQRWEFQNASKRRLMSVLGKDYNDNLLLYENNMVYSCTNVVSEVHEGCSFLKADYTVLSIGRLDKPYIMQMTEEIKAFASKYSEKSFNIIYIGGSYSGDLERTIQGVLSPLNNANIYMLGYAFPVPKSVLDVADVAIACANSVCVTANRDIPTIVVDMNDHRGIGVYGYDTNNLFARTYEPQIDIGYLLEAVLIKGLYERKGIITNTSLETYNAFEKERSFIEKSQNNKGYYDVLEAYSFPEKVVKGIKYSIIMIFGSMAVEKMKSLFNRRKSE